MNASVAISAIYDSITYAGLLFLVSSGFTLIFGLMRVLNLAHGAFYLWGAYIGVWAAARFGNIWVALVLASAGVAAFGVVAERLLFHRVRGDTQAEVLLTIGIAFVLGDVALMAFGGNPVTLSLPAYLSGSVTIFGTIYPVIRVALLAIASVVYMALVAMLKYTRAGALIRAAVDDREMLGALGVKVTYVYTGMFALASLLAGLAGLAGGAFLSVYPGADSQILLLALVIVVVGGLGSLHGAAIGSIITAGIVNFGTIVTPQLVYFLVFIPMLLILAIRPTGLMGRRWSS